MQGWPIQAQGLAVPRKRGGGQSRADCGTLHGVQNKAGATDLRRVGRQHGVLRTYSAVRAGAQRHGGSPWQMHIAIGHAASCVCSFFIFYFDEPVPAWLPVHEHMQWQRTLEKAHRAVSIRPSAHASAPQPLPLVLFLSSLPCCAVGGVLRPIVGLAKSRSGRTPRSGEGRHGAYEYDVHATYRVLRRSYPGTNRADKRTPRPCSAVEATNASRVDDTRRKHPWTRRARRDDWQGRALC